MPAFVTKNQTDILRQALSKLGDTTPLTAVGPGSIVRALTEVVVKELGDMYAIVDFNTSMSFLSTATGRALDMIGSLYNIPRKTLTEVAAIDQSIGAFYFYLDAPFGDDIVIPANVQISTDNTTFVGAQYNYFTTTTTTIKAGRTRAYASIRPALADSVYTAGANTLTVHNFPSPVGTFVRSTNPKPIQAQAGYEGDNAYRTRIGKAVRTSAGGTAEALRFTALSIPGVRDARVRLANFGLGSFEVVITPESQAVAHTVLVQADLTMQAVRPVGVRMFTKLPEYLPIEILATAVLKPGAITNRQDHARRVEIGAVRYLNTLLAGQPLVYNQLIQAMMESSDLVTDVVIQSFKVDAVEALRRNITVEEDQQIIPGSITVGHS
jgi:uncharacterized phage protein gp47/JayE